MAKPERHRVHRWQILIAGAGTLGENELYGRSIIADGRLESRYVGPHAMSLTFEDAGSDTNLFAYAFLCSGIGVRAIRSASYGTKILGIRKDLLAELPIPSVDPEVEARVAALVRRCASQREEYVRELQAARRVIEQLPAMREAHSMCAERHARTVVWSGDLPTLSAWNYASSGQALSHLARRWTARLRDVIEPNGLFYGARSSRIPCSPPFGCDFISQRDAFLIRPVPRRVFLRGVPDHMVFAPAGSILIAARGTLGEGEIFGRAVMVAGELCNVGLTEDLLRLRVRKEVAAVACAYLSTLVGLRLLRSTAVGTKILNLRFDLLQELPFPEINEEQASAVQAHIARSIEARSAAAHAEYQAVRIIEDEVLPAWLA
ncbi:hypothetical protein HJC22_13300 [Corallococcus exiguus]|uniref:hypothetical protein n=1 Tax=Corallococcus exiguus TaxID=83462 RepID=UPI0014723088|nr:hypothetical protein [Corallococcus exiguus]NNC16692.1 hypothetical protein [Corallococcus exiguus]